MHWAIGIDVGGTKIAGAMVNSDGETRGFRSVPIPAKGEPGLAAVMETTRGLLDLAKEDGREIDGVGIAVPGAVDVANGVVIRAPNLDWQNVPLRADFEAVLGVPIEVELDVRATALGAMLSDLARDVANFIYVTIGTGIGAGIVVNGELYYGAHSCSGEIGQCVLVEDGPRSGWGQRGCFETLGAGPALAERAGRIVRESAVTSILSESINTQGTIDPKQVFEAAAAGDPLACEAVRKTAEYIGRGLSLLINILDPQKIIIGGGVIKGGEHLLGLIRQYTAFYTYHRVCKNLEIVLSPDLDHLPVVGAANLIFKRRQPPCHG